MKISNIKIRNFKSIKEMDLNIKDLNVFIGANGAGKSNFISFFKLLNFLLEDELERYVVKYGGPDSLLYFGSKYSSELFLRVDFIDNHFFEYLLESAPEMAMLLVKLQTISWDKIPIERDKSKKNKQMVLEDENKIYNYTRAFAIAKIYHFHDTTPEARIKRPCEIDDNRYLKPDGSNLAAFLYYLQKKHIKYYERIQNTIRLVAPFFWKFDLAPDKDNENIIKLIWKHKDYDDLFFKVHHLSDGTLRMMCLITLLSQPELPDIILIDEPELGLHPSAITILAELLQSASIKSQVIISTQSVTLINHFEPEDIVVVDFEDNQSKFKRLNSKELEVWLEDYSLGEIWEKNIIGGRP